VNGHRSMRPADIQRPDPGPKPVVCHALNHGNTNGSLRTIPAEESFYLTIPSWYCLERRLGLKTMISVVAVLALAGTLLTLQNDASAVAVRRL
jgi:hypothetical protein